MYTVIHYLDTALDPLLDPCHGSHLCHIPFTLTQCQQTALYFFCTFKNRFCRPVLALNPCNTYLKPPTQPEGTGLKLHFCPPPPPYGPSGYPWSFSAVAVSCMQCIPKNANCCINTYPNLQMCVSCVYPKKNKCVSRSSSDRLDTLPHHLSPAFTARGPALVPSSGPSLAPTPCHICLTIIQCQRTAMEPVLLAPSLPQPPATSHLPALSSWGHPWTLPAPSRTVSPSLARALTLSPTPLNLTLCRSTALEAHFPPVPPCRTPGAAQSSLAPAVSVQPRCLMAAPGLS